MRYTVSQTHTNQEEPNKFWFVIDVATNKRVGYGFADFTNREQAYTLASCMNEAYREGLIQASVTLVNK